MKLVGLSTLLVGAFSAGTKITFREKGSAPGASECIFYADFEGGTKTLKSTCDVQFHQTSVEQPMSLKAVHELTDKLRYYVPKPQSCPLPTIAPDTSVGGHLRGLNASALTTAVTGDQGAVDCNEGFHTVSPVELRCFIDGFRAGPFDNNFNGESGDGIYPVCQPITCPAETVTITDNKGISAGLHFPITENSLINPGSATISRECPGTHKGTIVRMCEEKMEQWTSTGACEEKQCQGAEGVGLAVSIAGTSEIVDFESILQGNSETKNCPSGYVGTITVDCPAQSEMHSTTHDCVRQCAAFNGPANGNGCVAMLDGTTCHQGCDYGYVRDDDQHHKSQLSTAQEARVCQTDGSWSGSAPVCIRRCNEIPAATGLSGISASYLDATATHACATGYSGTSTTRTCQADGSWGGSAPTCLKICHAVSAANGAAAISQGVDGDTVNHSCAATYSGSTVQRTCQSDGTWSSTAPSCLKICSAINAATSHSGVSGGVAGDTRSHACAATYSGTSQSRTCLADGTWGGSHPTCSKICASISSSTGINAVAEGVEGNQISHTCAGGYSGAAQTRTCQSTGSWSGAAPSCLKVCGSIAAANGADALSSGTAGKWHSCAGTHSGTQTWRACGTNGNWGGSAPTCYQKCAALSSGTGYGGVNAGVHGDSSTQACSTGYDGTSTVRTCSDGTWTGSNPTCTAPGYTMTHDHQHGFYYNGAWTIDWPTFKAGSRQCGNQASGDQTCVDGCLAVCEASGHKYCTILWREAWWASSYGVTRAVGCLHGDAVPTMHDNSVNSYYNSDTSTHWVFSGRRLVDSNTTVERRRLLKEPIRPMNELEKSGQSVQRYEEFLNELQLP